MVQSIESRPPLEYRRPPNTTYGATHDLVPWVDPRGGMGEIIPQSGKLTDEKP